MQHLQPTLLTAGAKNRMHADVALAHNHLHQRNMHVGSPLDSHMSAAGTGRAVEVNLRNNMLTGSLPLALSSLPIVVRTCPVAALALLKAMYACLCDCLSACLSDCLPFNCASCVPCTICPQHRYNDAQGQRPQNVELK